ncbi:hypothetical protein ACF0H5_017053 [Mactra antiquata]
MNSEGYSSCSSDSDISESSIDVCLEPEASMLRYRQRRQRRSSVNSVSTNPEEDTYVMVLQNKTDIVKTSSLRDLSDVTFLVGPDRKPVSCIRAVIARKSSVLEDLMLSFERNHKKQGKKSSIKKAFKKINNLNCAHQRRKGDTGDMLTMPIDSFDADTFQRLMNYVHCGTLTVDPATVVGLINAAYMFELPEVQHACWDFALGCLIRPDNLQDILNSAKVYADHKMTQELLVQMRQFIANNADRIMYSRFFEEQTNLILKSARPDVTSIAT